MRELIRGVFLAPFRFRFASSLPDTGYLSDVVEWAERDEGEVIERGADRVRLVCPARRLFRSLLVGRMEVEVTREGDEFSFLVRFSGSQRRYYIGVSAISSLVLLSAISSHEIGRLAVIPVLFASGHLYFMALLFPRARGLRNRLIYLK